MDLQESAPMVPEALLDMGGKASIWTERRPDVESPLAAKLSCFLFTGREPFDVGIRGALVMKRRPPVGPARGLELARDPRGVGYE
jgi:hypothetical protein